MAARDKFLLLDPKNLLSTDFIPSLLGRICTNANQPWSNFFPVDPSPFYSNSAAPFFIESNSTSLLLGRNTTATARLVIESILTVGREKANHPQASWFGERCRVFNLPQEDEVLSNILNDSHLKKKAEDFIYKYGELYMVTGFVTVVNASCHVGDSNSAGINFEAPISTALEAAIAAAGGVPIALPTISAEWQKRIDNSVQWSATYAGESIIAIRCRRLHRKGWILSRLLDGEIAMKKSSDIRGAEDMMFGDEDDDNAEEVEKWEDYISHGLEEDEQEEIAFSPSLEPEFLGRDGNVSASATLQPSVTRKCSLPSVTEEIQWYFEEYSKQPFSTIRAKNAKALIDSQGSLLLEDLCLNETSLPMLDINSLIFQIIEGPSIFKIHWEALESFKLWDSCIKIHVCRIAKGGKEQLQRAPTNSGTSKVTNVLLIVARKSNDAIDPRLVAQPLVHALGQDCPGLVSVDIAQPGTIGTFKEYLQKKDYDIVHLDVHGIVKDGRASLLFQNPSGDTVIGVSADDIARLLFVNRVKLVVINACQSASTMGSSTANFACQLASHGVPYVLGMAFKVTDTAISIFTSALHGSLLWKNLDILSAVHEARAKLRTDTNRNAFLFDLTISVQDDILPVLYASDGQLDQHFGSLSQGAPCDPPTGILEASDKLLGRGLDMLKVENRLIRDKVCIVYGFHGVGKRSLIDNLARWCLESRLVEDVYSLDLSHGISSLESALAAISRQIVSESGAGQTGKNCPEDLILEAVASRNTLITIKNADRDEDWLADLCLKLPLAERCSDAARLSVLISSIKPLDSVRERIRQMRNRKIPDYELTGLSSRDAMSLAGNLQGRIRQEEEQYSALWYRQRTLELLQKNPLATEVLIAATARRSPSEIYWNLKTQRLDLTWESTGAKELCIQWQYLVEHYPDLLKALVPFITWVPNDYLANDPAIGQESKYAKQILIEAGCANPKATGRIQLHPLFIHFVRSQPWHEADIKASWHRAAVYYQQRSIDWIRAGLHSTTTTQPTMEWENLTSVLCYLVPTLESDTEESSLFDLSWIVSSFHAFQKDAPKHTVDMFADLTLKALNAMVPSLVPTTNEALRIVVENGLRLRASILSDFQILRATFLVQFLVQYYYHISPSTANIYEEALVILQGSTSDGVGDAEFAGLLQMASTISSLTKRELALELQLMPQTMGSLSSFPPGMSIPLDFRAFAERWDESQTLRFIGYHVDPVKTFNNQKETMNKNFINRLCVR
ncbi:hypothetical protein IL306_009474 [Fusarium sp. DS 682]|nr:hypothetical protein IL306_009474 [Fusarium sp. DS 682]